ncbi:MAG: GPW/gp25 family protein [Candidatus Thiodiazotropha sp. L084R]
MRGRHLAFPFHIAADGRSAAPASLEEHVKSEIIQLLLTNPGERPFLPAFGGGLRRLVFEGNSDITTAVAKATLTNTIGRWLKTRVELTALEVESRDATLIVGLQYRVIATGETQALSFEHRS